MMTVNSESFEKYVLMEVKQMNNVMVGSAKFGEAKMYSSGENQRKSCENLDKMEDLVKCLKRRVMELEDDTDDLRMELRKTQGVCMKVAEMIKGPSDKPDSERPERPSGKPEMSGKPDSSGKPEM